MNESLTDTATAERGSLRALMAQIDGELATLRARGGLDGTARHVETLARAWAQLTHLIALEPEPELRTCPHCERRVMRAATRCVHCWKRSEPEAAGP